MISKNGVSRARLIAVPAFGARRKPVDAMKISYLDADFDVPDRGIERLFYVNE